MFDPCLLHWRQTTCGKTFNGRDAGVLYSGDWCHTTAHRLAVNMNCAGAAGCNAATEFGSGQSEFVAKCPQQGHIRLNIELPGFSIYIQLYHDMPLWLS